MKKAERLAWVANHYGPEFSWPFRECFSWNEIEAAITALENRKTTWGMRTDTRDGGMNFHLPFILHGNKAGVREVWDKYGVSLSYIISPNITRYFLNAVALRIDSEYVQFEYNPVDQHLAQRNMYDCPKHVHHLLIGPMRRRELLRDFGFPFTPVGPVFLSEDQIVRDLRFDRVFNLMTLFPNEREITFSVPLPGKRVVIW